MPLVAAPAPARQSTPARQPTSAQQTRLREANQLTRRLLELDRQGQHREALDLARQALAIRNEILGARHADTANAEANVGMSLYRLGRYDEALPHMRRSLANLGLALGDKHPDVALAANNLGYLLFSRGELVESRRLLEQALATWRAARGPRHPDVANALNNLGLLLQEQAKYAAARRNFAEALRIRQAALGEQNELTALSYNNLGHLLETEGDLAGAHRNHQRALEIRLALLGEDHPATATSLNNMGMLLFDEGDPAAARDYLERALRARKKVLGRDHPDTAISFNNLGSLWQSLGKPDQAVANYAEARRIWLRALGGSHPTTSTARHNLGTAYLDLGRHAEARQELTAALAVRERAFGDKHPFCAYSHAMLGEACWLQGELPQARSHAEQALTIWQAHPALDNAEMAGPLHRLADVSAVQEDWNAAAEFMDRARRALGRYAARTLPALGEREQLAFLKRNDQVSLQLSLSLGYARRDDAGLRDKSAEWLLNGKAVSQEALAQQALLARDAATPALREIVRELLETRRRLASLGLELPAPGQEKTRKALFDELSQQERELTRRLGDAGSLGAEIKTWAELAALRSALSEKEVFVDLARLEPYLFKPAGIADRRQKPRYVAWIVPPAGAREVAIVDLGEAAPIEAAIERARQTIQARGRSGADPAQSDRSTNTALRSLAELVLLPLLDKAGAAPDLVISPDSELWLVPWGALLVDERAYLIEQRSIRYVVSGRDLLPRAKRSAATANKSVVMADPDYDLPPADVVANTAAVLRGGTPATATRGANPTASGRSRLAAVHRLPGTAVEARAIVPRLAAYTGGEPQVYTGRYALEGVFKKVARPQVLVLSTHGYFLPDQVLAPAALDSLGEGGAALADDGAPLENPLARCGLLLAGCNRRDAASTGGDDGVLTGLEIIGCDMVGARLVVLSACETGLGQVRNGEGVAGLRQAFQLAGAQSVVATLWQIPDRQSALLMGDFFDQLAAGRSPVAALQAAQLNAISASRAATGAAPPYFWAAFTITGDH